MGTCMFLWVDLKPEGPSVCSRGLINSLAHSTRVHTCGCVHVCMRAFMGCACLYTFYSVCRCVCTYVCVCAFMAMCIWGDWCCMQAGQLCAFTQTQVPSDIPLTHP